MSGKYQPPHLTLPVGDRDHIEGPASAAVVLVEYGDYQCPYCGAAYPIIKRVQKTFGARLRFVFRNFPITNAHAHAGWAAEFAEAAGAQGPFWPIHDFLYEHQAALGEPAVFTREAKRLGLDVARIDRDVAEHTFRPRVEEDFSSGVRSGVNGTPTFFVNGVRYDGYPEYVHLVEALEAAEKASTRR
jgi:protein-disulfide isomerase